MFTTTNKKPFTILLLVVLVAVLFMVVLGMFLLKDKAVKTTPAVTENTTSNTGQPLTKEDIPTLTVPEDWTKKEFIHQSVIEVIYQSNDVQTHVLPAAVISVLVYNQQDIERSKEIKDLSDKSFYNYSKEVFNVEGGEGYRVEYDGTAFGVEGHTVRIDAYKDGKSYAINATTLKSDWNTYKQTIQLALQSLKLP